MVLFVVTLLLLGVVAYLLRRLATTNHGYWRRRGVLGPKPAPFFGTHKNIFLLRESYASFYQRVYNEFPGATYVGLLSARRPGLLVRDPELIKHIMTKDFEFFPNRGVPHNEKVLPLTANLFNIEGVRWRNLRIKLSPTFTSGKMKHMFPLMLECGRELTSLLREYAVRGDVIELKDILARFTTDVIGSCAFGVNCNSLKDPNAEFRIQGMKIFAVSPMNVIRLALLSAFPKAHYLHRMFRNASVEDFFVKVMNENIAYRERNNIKRDDFLDMLMELKNKGRIVDSVDITEDAFLKLPVSSSADELQFTDALLVAQAFVFFVAGFETSSTTMSFSLLELAHNPDIQTKLQTEIDYVLRRHGGITYQALSEMTYLDKVVSETLRKYPPLGVLMREAAKPYKIPGSDLVLEAGTRVYIPAFALQHDPAIYQEPERFDPERFSSENKAARHPYTYLPFGEGPRICIGMRFGLLQTKLGLVSVLSQCTVEPSSSTQYPVKIKTGAFITTSEGGCLLTVKERSLAVIQ